MVKIKIEADFKISLATIKKVTKDVASKLIPIIVGAILALMNQGIH